MREYFHLPPSKRPDIGDFNADMERLIAAGEKALSITSADREYVTDSIPPDSIVEAQCSSHMHIRNHLKGGIAVSCMIGETLPEDVIDALIDGETGRTHVMKALSPSHLEQRIREALGEDPCAYLNSIGLKYSCKREGKRPLPRGSP